MPVLEPDEVGYIVLMFRVWLDWPGGVLQALPHAVDPELDEARRVGRRPADVHLDVLPLAPLERALPGEDVGDLVARGPVRVHHQQQAVLVREERDRRPPVRAGVPLGDDLEAWPSGARRCRRACSTSTSAPGPPARSWAPPPRHGRRSCRPAGRRPGAPRSGRRTSPRARVSARPGCGRLATRCTLSNWPRLPVSKSPERIWRPGSVEGGGRPAGSAWSIRRRRYHHHHHRYHLRRPATPTAPLKLADLTSIEPVS